MFKVVVFVGFIMITTFGVQKGHQQLLLSLDNYVHHSYGVLAESDSEQLSADGESITRQYRLKRQAYDSQ